MSDKESTSGKGWFRNRNRKVIVLITGTAIALGGVFGVQAFANSNSFGHMKLAASFVGGSHSGGHARFADWSDADIEASVERMVGHLAIEIDATTEQKEKITAVATALAADLKPVHERMRESGDQLHDLLVADTIDRAALEQLRAERLADAEVISVTLVSALADVAEVLSAEQRKVLDERFSQFHSMHRGGHRG